jgi:hypothetical protein
MKKIYLLLPIALIILVSCKKDLPDIGGTAAQKMANEWWVTLDQGADKDVFGLGHFKIATYNTAANNDSIWINDFGNGWGVQFKAAADFNNLTFSAKNASNYAYPITINVTEGKVLVKMGHSKTGNVTDSIHMKIEFSDDPGTIYEMNGHARTMFSEDEY